jgi:acyl-CoA synthetase (AMP-forming)/AMP-acid ligase II
VRRVVQALTARERVHRRQMPYSSCSTFATGARQLVVRDALLITRWLPRSWRSWLKPSTSVRWSSITLEELVAFLTDRAPARFKLPERLEVVDDLPLSRFGKVAKNKLSEIAAAKVAGIVA